MKVQAIKVVVAFCISLLAVLLLSTPAYSQPAELAVQDISRADPEKMLRQATAELLEVSKAAQSYAKADPERYYAKVAGTLEQVMDIQYFARGVMATYASARLYKSLQSEVERAAFRQRQHHFAVALKRVWMVKYADALLSFQGQTIEVERVNAAGDGDGRATVKQTIHDQDNQTYLVNYSLRKQKDNLWLIANVIVEGINLGESYRNQFAAAVENNKGDVDYVVEHWVELMLHNHSTVGDAGQGVK